MAGRMVAGGHLNRGWCWAIRVRCDLFDDGGGGWKLGDGGVSIVSRLCLFLSAGCVK